MYIIKKILALSILTLSVSANAGFIKTDWEALGDNQALLHEETGIEWLNLNNTAEMSMNQVLNNSRYNGWRLATGAEVERLIVDFFPELTFNEGQTTIEDINQTTNARRWISLMGLTADFSATRRSFGLYYENEGLYMSGAMENSQIARIYDDIGPYANSDDYYDFSNRVFSIFMVSDGGTTLSSINDPTINENNETGMNAVSVSESPSIALVGLSALCLMIGRKIKLRVNIDK